MDFDQFWDRLSKELETARTFYTLKQSKEFKAIMTDSLTVTATPKSSTQKESVEKEERPIKRDVFQEMWDLIKDDHRSERYVGSNGRFKKFWNPVYVCALIDHVVGDQDME